jgi:hypothetical protein
MSSDAASVDTLHDSNRKETIDKPLFDILMAMEQINHCWQPLTTFPRYDILLTTTN